MELKIIISDFPERDSLPQTLVPKSKWSTKGSYGPAAAEYPPWQYTWNVESYICKERILAVAKHFIGIKYYQGHIPERGLDCSNFTAWVMNYGFGIKISGGVSTQAKNTEAGAKINSIPMLEMGDIIFIFNPEKTQIGHSAIYIDDKTLIDSTIDKTGNGVYVRKFSGWYRDRFSHARRMFL